MSSEDKQQHYRTEKSILDDVASGKLSTEDAINHISERRRWNRRKVHMKASRGLIVTNNLFGPRGPSTVVLSKAQWEKHVRFVNSGVMERFIESNSTHLYDRDRDGEYNRKQFERTQRNSHHENDSKESSE